MSDYREHDFAFEHIIFLSNRDLWVLLSETDNVTILQACYNVDDVILVRIRSVFSKTACDYFNDDLSKFWMTSKDEAIRARHRMVRIFHKLYRRGRLKDWSLPYAA